MPDPHRFTRPAAVGSDGQPRAPKMVNLGRVADVDLAQVPALNDCKPGLIPTEYNVVIAPAVMAERIGSIMLADDTREALGMAMQVGRLVIASGVAFNYEKWPEGTSPPKAGDIVWFARYAGGEFTGSDGRTYRIVKDKDIGAIIPNASASWADQKLLSEAAMADAEGRN